MRNLFLTFIFAALLMSCTVTSPLRTEQAAVLITGNDTTKFVAVNSDIISAANALTAVKTGRFAPTKKNGVRVYYSNYTNTHQNMAGAKPSKKWIGTINLRGVNYKIYKTGDIWTMDGTRIKRRTLRSLLAGHMATDFNGDEEYRKIYKKIKWQ